MCKPGGCIAGGGGLEVCCHGDRQVLPLGLLTRLLYWHLEHHTAGPQPVRRQTAYPHTNCLDCWYEMLLACILILYELHNTDALRVSV